MIVVPLHRRDRLRDRRCVPLANASISNTPIGPFQTTVFAPAMTVAIARDRLRADVEPHAIADRRVADRQRLGRRAGFELRRDDVIDRQLERAGRAPWRALDVARRVEQVVLDERLADRQPARLEERVGHRAADEQRVDAGEQVLDHLELVGDLRAAEDRDERPLRAARARGPRYSTSAAISSPAAASLT